MKERPILFAAPMVRALLDGSKTQTRRVLKQATGPSLSVGIEDEPGVAELSWLSGDGPGHDVQETIRKVPCPYGMPGDRLWVREAFRVLDCWDRDSPVRVGELCLDAGYPKPWAPTQYEADGARDNWVSVGTVPGTPTPGKLRPGIHMPRWASRVDLEVTGVRVERLQVIGEADAQQEGLLPLSSGIDRTWTVDGLAASEHETARETYAWLWDEINGAGNWAANPWVWVVEFRRVRP